MHFENASKESWVLWQNSMDNEDEMPGEPALLIEKYNDIISIRQEDRYININLEMIDELCKRLKQINKGSL